MRARRKTGRVDHNATRRFLRAAVDNDMSTLRSLLEDGVAADARHPTPHSVGPAPWRRMTVLTALQVAAAAGNLEMAELLVGAGADAELPAEQGMRPLHLAAAAGHTAMIELLVRLGASRDSLTSDAQAQSALHVAAMNDHAPALQSLLALGLRPGASDGTGLTALHYGAMHGARKAMALLLREGAAVEAPSPHFFTPLHFAAENGHEEAICLLLRWHARVHCRTSYGSTPLHLASRNFHAGCVAALLRSGASPLLRTDLGMNALHAARFGAGDRAADAAFGLAVARMRAERVSGISNFTSQGGEGDVRSNGSAALAARYWAVSEALASHVPYSAATHFIRYYAAQRSGFRVRVELSIGCDPVVRKAVERLPAAVMAYLLAFWVGGRLDLGHGDRGIAVGERRLSDLD